MVGGWWLVVISMIQGDPMLERKCECELSLHMVVVATGHAAEGK